MGGKKQHYNYNRLKEVLAAVGKTQKSLAEHLDVNEPTVSTWCTNDRQPPVETFFAIAKFLGVETRELFTLNSKLRIVVKKKTAKSNNNNPPKKK